MIYEATTELLFLLKRFMASLKYPTGFVSSFLSCIRPSGGTNSKADFGILLMLSYSPF